MLWLALTEDSLLAEFLGRLLQGRMFVHLKLSDAHADPARDIPEFVSDKLSQLGYTTAAVLLDAALFPAVRQGNRYAALRLFSRSLEFEIRDSRFEIGEFRISN